MTAGMRTTVVLSALGIALLVTAAPAAAHTSLIGTSPEADATVTEELSHVVLEFNEPVNQTIGEVTVHAPDGTVVADGDADIDGARVSQQLGALTQTGAHTVSYRVVASDGHPLTGTFDFVYDGPTAGAETEPPPTSTPATTEPEDPDPTPQAMTTPEDADPTPEATEPEDATRPDAEGDETEMAAPPAVRDDGSAQEEAAAVTAGSLPLLLLAVAVAIVLALVVAAARAVRTLARWEPVQ